MKRPYGHSYNYFGEARDFSRLNGQQPSVHRQAFQGIICPYAVSRTCREIIIASKAEWLIQKPLDIMRGYVMVNRQVILFCVNLHADVLGAVPPFPGHETEVGDADARVASTSAFQWP